MKEIKLPKEELGDLEFLVLLPVCIGIFVFIGGILTRGIYMFALGVLCFLCAGFIYLALSGILDSER